MKTLLSIIALFLSCTLLAQTNKGSKVTYSEGDTSFWHKYMNIAVNDLSLTRLDTSGSPFYFRVWKTNQVLDIWQTNGGSYAGQLTSWVNERALSNEKSTGRMLIDKKTLRVDTVMQILDIIKLSQIMKLPTDDSIKGWKRGFDGVTYTFEILTETDYSFKTYWTPRAQDTNLVEAKHVQSFVDKTFELSNSTAIWKQFEKNIPYECYYVGATSVCKVLTKKERRKLAKERKNYLQQK